MAFDNWIAFIHMGGYGAYVWLSFFLTFLVIAGLALESIWARRRLKQQCKTLQRRKQRLAKRQTQQPPQGQE